MLQDYPAKGMRVFDDPPDGIHRHFRVLTTTNCFVYNFVITAALGTEPQDGRRRLLDFDTAMPACQQEGTSSLIKLNAIAWR